MFIIMSFLLVIIICSSFFVNADDAAADCLCDTPQNRGVLLAFQRITGNAWTFDTSISLCSWGNTAVTCNDTIVTAVDLRGGGLFGNFSAILPSVNSTTFSFSGLSSLRTLDLTKNPLLYASIQQFEFPPSLRVLRLPSGFTGKCPEQLLNLTTFSCPQCGLQGPLPTSWCSNSNTTSGNTTTMQLLQVIELTGNAGLVGPLPSSWAACPLTLVDVSGIRSAGAIPPSWREEQQLMAKTIARLRLGSSGLLGDLPGAWFTSVSFPKLVELSAPDNLLNGTLPISISQAALMSLDLSYNQLSGQIPQTLAASLSTLKLSRNAFDGALPAVLPSAMTVIDVSDNTGLTGPIPVDWSEGASAPALQQILLGGCKLNGSVPQGWLYTSAVEESLVTLNLSHNQFQGGLLMTTFGLSSTVVPKFLSSFDVSWNKLSGSLPTFVNSIALVDVSHNQLQGSVPLTLPTSYFDASDNLLTGSLIAWGTQIGMLDLSFNQLSGALPSGGAMIFTASLLNLSHNLFSGVLPDSIGDTATTVDVSWNRLVLPLPSVGTAGLMSSLSLAHNALVGGLAPGGVLVQQASLFSLDLSDNAITSIVTSPNNATAQLVTLPPNLQRLTLRNCSVQRIPDILPDTLQQLDLSANIELGGSSGGQQLSGLWRWSFALRSVILSDIPLLVLRKVPIALCARLYGAELITLGGGFQVRFPKIQINLLGTRVEFRNRTGVALLVSNYDAQDAWVASWCRSETNSVAISASHAAPSPSMTPTKSPTFWRNDDPHRTTSSSKSITYPSLALSVDSTKTLTLPSTKTSTISRTCVITPSATSASILAESASSPWSSSRMTVTRSASSASQSTSLNSAATNSHALDLTSTGMLSTTPTLPLPNFVSVQVSAVVASAVSTGAATIAAIIGASQATSAFVAIGQGGPSEHEVYATSANPSPQQLSSNSRIPSTPQPCRSPMSHSQISPTTPPHSLFL